MCELLRVSDAKIVTVALEGIENILKAGASFTSRPDIIQQIVTIVEEAGGLQRIEDLQNHDSLPIYERAVKILETYFCAEEETEEAGQFGYPAPPMQQGAPQPPAAPTQYTFGVANNTPTDPNAQAGAQQNPAGAAATPQFHF